MASRPPFFFGGADLLTCFRLTTNLEARLEKEEELHVVFRDQEMPLVPILASEASLLSSFPRWLAHD